MLRRPSASWIIALISLPIFIGALDLTVVSAVLPHVIYDLEIPLQSGLDDAAWLVSGYLLAYTIAMTFMGRLSDIYGRRRIYLLALVIFACGSYLVAVGETWPTRLGLRLYTLFTSGRADPARISLLVLIAARMIQAFGGGAMVPVGMALAGDLYPAGSRAKALGIIAAVDTAGWVVGHLYGGIVVRYFDWRMIFWLNLPFCLLAFILIAIALRNLPHDSEETAPSRMDWLGAALISLALAALNLGLSSNTETTNNLSFENTAPSSWPSGAVPLLIAAAVFIGLFLWRQSRSRSPLMSLVLFRQPNFSVSGLANFMIGVGLFIAIANVPLFINTLQAQTLEQGAWDSGWMLSALTVPMALASVPGGWLAARFGYRWPSVLGLLMAVAGFGVMSTWKMDTSYQTMVPHLVLAGAGFGLTMAPVAAAAVNASPSSYRGTASALVIIFRLVGMTVGISSMTTYGLERMDYLSRQLLTSGATLAEAAQAGMTNAETVISETFWIAAGVSLLALFPVFKLRVLLKERSSST